MQPEDPHRRVIQPVQHARARRKVVQLLGGAEVARVEQHAEGPAREPDVAEQQVVAAQRVRGGDALAQPAHAVVVREEVEQREDDRERLLHAQEAMEGPLAVELQDRLAVGRVAGEARVRDDVLAGVVALGWAGPEEEAALEGFAGL